MLFLLGSGWQIENNLREFSDNMGEVVGSVSFGDDFGDHESGEHTIAGSLAWQNDVAGLFPADFDAIKTHGFGDVGITNGGDFGFDIVIFGPINNALVGHDSNSDLVKFEVISEDGDDFVTINFIPCMIDKKTAVAVAIKSDAEVEMLVSDELLE